MIVHFAQMPPKAAIQLSKTKKCFEDKLLQCFLLLLKSTFVTYLKWNNLIGASLFNEGMAGREVYLFVRKQDVIRIGRESENFEGQTNDHIWQDFIRSVKNGLPGEDKTDLERKINSAYRNFVVKKLIGISGEPFTFPPYLSYLLLTVLPIVEDESPLRANNYYKRITAFLKANELPTLRDATPQKNCDLAWQHLADWSTLQKQGAWGIFTKQNFSGYVHVGLPMSQCLFDPRGFKLLPEAFARAGFVPGLLPSQETMRKTLIENWVSVLRQRPTVLDNLKKSDDDLGQVVVAIACRIFAAWEGDLEIEPEQAGLRESDRQISRQRARLYLSFIKQRDGVLDWGVRMNSTRPYPEDLTFPPDLHCKDVLRNGWSNHMKHKFSSHLTLRDPSNRWEAVLPEKQLRLFIAGRTLGLNSDSWVETDQLNRYEPTYILCADDCANKVMTWGEHFPTGSFKQKTEHDFDGIPVGCQLFWFSGPSQGLDGEANLPMEKKMAFVGGVKTGYRTWLPQCPPEVKIESAAGNESPYYVDPLAQIEIKLSQKPNTRDHWLLPNTLPTGQEYGIIAANLPKQTFRTDDGSGFARLCAGPSANPRRDYFGNPTEAMAGGHAIGNKVAGIQSTFQTGYLHHFKPVQRGDASVINGNVPSFNPANDWLLHFLACRRDCRVENFYEAFEQVLAQSIVGEWNPSELSLSACKRIVLNLYDALGYVDFDYQQRRIVANPPQLLLLPTESGLRALLTGVRTPEFVQKVFGLAAERGLSIRIVSKAGTVADWQLLPDTITLESCKPYSINHELKIFAQDLHIPFQPDDIAQWALLHFSASLDDFKNTLGRCRSERFEDYGTFKVFNAHTFQFESAEGNDFDKTFALVEYRQNAYTYEHILWIDCVAHRVDKSWGRWLVIQKIGWSVVFVDENKRAAYIPAALPLPYLLAKGLLLCSGRVPERKRLEINGVKALFSKYDNMIFTFLSNELSKIGQKPVPITSIQTC